MINIQLGMKLTVWNKSAAPDLFINFQEKFDRHMFLFESVERNLQLQTHFTNQILAHKEAEIM